MKMSSVTANGLALEAKLLCSIEAFIVAQQHLLRSVVVEHNGEADAKNRQHQDCEM